MNFRHLGLLLGGVVLTLTGMGAWAQAEKLVSIAETNQVDAQGNPTFPGLQTMDKYTIQGRVLNEPHVFNSEGDTSFVLFVQDDTGGIQVYSGAWYGGGINSYPDKYGPGLLVMVTGLTGHFGGKTNINERHNPDQKFTVSVANTPAVEPAPLAIESLAGLNDFDATRQTGGEFYQGRLVVLKNVRIVEGAWEAGAMLKVADAAGHTFAVELRHGSKIGESPQPQGWLDIVGVFNQEDPEPPFTEGYRLWPRSIADFKASSSPSAAERWHEYR
ncbi:MAG TPA: hypothetical protein PK360_13700 [bacterium]|nr:hypothetical protein [bacterium]